LSDILKIESIVSGSANESFVFTGEEIRRVILTKKSGEEIRYLQNRKPLSYLTSNPYYVITVEFYLAYKSTLTKIESINSKTNLLTVFYDYKNNPAISIPAKLTGPMEIKTTFGRYVAGYITNGEFTQVKTPVNFIDVSFNEDHIGV